MFLYQSQPPNIVDAQPPNLHKKHSRKPKHVCASNVQNLNYPILENLSFPIPSDSVDCGNDALTNPTNQPIDSSTIGHWLQSCTNVNEVRKLHALVIKRVEDEVTYVNNNLISKYVEFGDLVVARQVFDNMLDRNVVSWTAMLNGYERHGMENEAFRLFVEFANCGIHGNARTYVCLLKLFGRTFQYELGRQLHACIIKNQVSNFILDCTILHLYARCGDLDSAFEVFDHMRNPDVIAWTTMITACSQHRRGKEAFIMLSRMLSDGLDPNEFTVCSVLNACAEEKELRLGTLNFSNKFCISN